jgi:hypothetical protein
MKRFQGLLLSVPFALLSFGVFAQSSDSTQNISTFSGNIGITNNGFSIIPSFSLNHPAFVTNFSFRKKNLSFEPDIRMVPSAKKGSMLWWVKYRLVDDKKFGLRVGAHPAFTLIQRQDTEDGDTKEITEMLRFVAYEVVPSYQFNNTFGISLMYLEGHGLQKHGPQQTKVLFFNTSITNIGLGKDLTFNLFPSVYYLYTDRYKGSYIAATAAFAHKKSPFSLQGTVNQTIKSDVPGNQDFMWNVTLNYHFSNVHKRVI